LQQQGHQQPHVQQPGMQIPNAQHYPMQQ
jgi:hypothetical protein